MSVNVSAWAIRRPLPSVLLFVALLGLGIVGFLRLPISYFPTIDVPRVSVSITDSGASPEQIEAAITRRVEDSVARILGIDKLSSTIRDGESVTTIDFDLAIPVDRAVTDVRDAVAAIVPDLPATTDQPVIQRVDVENGAVVRYAVSDRSMSAVDLSFFVDDVVLRRLRALPGVGRIDRVGGVDREIEVRLDPDRLLALGVTVAEVNRQLGALAVNRAAGTTEAGGLDRALSASGEINSLGSLRATRITLADGSAVALEDLGTIRDADADPAGFAILDGHEVIGFTVFRAPGASEDAVAEAVATLSEELESEHAGLAFTLIDDSVTYTLGNYHAAMSTLVEGSLLAMAVVFLFLRDWRATLIAAVALPLAAIPTFFAMLLFGFSLNVISLLGITLVAGILVDDAIVEIENVARHGAMGKSAWDAAIDASDEIGLAVVAISATIIAVFVPVGFMGGVVGQYFREFGVTVAIAVFFSLLVARLVTPLLAARLMRLRHETPRPPGRAMRLYGDLARLAVAAPLATVTLAVALFALSVGAATGLPTEFLPAEDNGRLQLSIELPPGSTLAETRAAASEITQAVGALEDVAHVFIEGGVNALGVRELRRAAVLVTLHPKDNRQDTAAAIARGVADRLRTVPDIRFEILNSRGGRDVSLDVLSRDGAAASRAAAAILRDLSTAPFAVGEASSEAGSRPELRLRLLPERMADAGVTTAAITETLSVSTRGAAKQALPDFTDGERRIPIRLRLSEVGRDSIETLEALRVPTFEGGTIPLAQVASFETASRLSRIQRFDRERRVEIGFDMASGMAAGDGLRAFMALPSVRSLPDDVRVVPSGDSDTQGEVFAGFAVAMGTGIGLVLVVLILLFNSLLTPLTILVTLPLSAGGVVLALLVTGTAVSLPVVIGILMLMGIVTKNAIMLIDFALDRERAGMSRRDASVAAGMERARPIVMTTLAMVAGMVPAAIGIGEGGGIRSPMAIAVIGGLVVSTLLSLVVVPALHCLFGDWTAWAARLRNARRATSSASDTGRSEMLV
ncbi:efflux RND transporter permease subunit [Aureimonas sp. AU40]|uniref:efflux RND transporter permease subunit n=1 Tax=Aureimonas sp. AU40 TaxID=1637747 RepID=UPI0009EC9F81|nr:efflux RND transporter permease subunit [Aureimonas sp. AU40]